MFQLQKVVSEDFDSSLAFMYSHKMDFIHVPDNFAMASNFSLQQLPVTNKRPLQRQPSTSVNVNPPTKPRMKLPIKPRVQPLSKPVMQPRSKPQPATKPQASSKTHLQPPPKAQESFENVRSKLRESLSEALTLVDQAKTAQKDESQSLQVSEDASAPKQSPPKLPERQVETEVPSHQEDAFVALSSSVELKSAQTTAVGTDCTNALEADANCTCSLAEATDQTSTSGNTDLSQSVNERSLVGNYIDEDKLEFAKMWSCDQEFNPRDIFPEEETSFILKNDLLQGNELYWASDIDLDDFDMSDMRDAKKPKRLEEDPAFPNDITPQTLAAKIEEELFKLFGSVNKKYKEKGRSLLFNLKDRNNPELRERVMAGEIPPEKLCAMTAEELASKELSQWRIAKAEELAQMVVLPDSDIDLRRVVKKTHKGEFQVEFEQDDGTSVEVAIGESSLIKLPNRTPVTEDETKEKVEIKTSEKASSETDKLVTDSLTSLDSGKGLVVNAELKDTKLLPPIVSLDEFMESSNGSLPSDNPPNTVAEDMTLKDGILKRTEPVKDLTSSDLRESMDLLPKEEKAEVERKGEKTGSDIKSDDNKNELTLFVDENKGDKIWNGILQLTISSVITVTGFFKSGEKTLTIEWPSMLEIKGRVRLDAFRKFLQELPQSRSRAIMVVHFCWEEGSPKSGQSKLQAVESFVADVRIGFAEPAPGVELYVCSSDSSTTEMLSGLLPEDNADAVKNLDSGLIGIVVWRRAMFSTTSPRPSYHRQNSRKHCSSSIKKQEKSPRVGQSQGPPPAIVTNPDAMSDDDDDDVPPGFGPGAGRRGRDDDDLPEFQFGKTSEHSYRQSIASGGGVVGRADRPVELVRDLIHKYGQNKPASSPMTWDPRDRGARIEIQPWNDDDDIPDWQPGREVGPRSHPHPAALPIPTAGHPYRQHSLQTPMVVPHQPQLVDLQPPLRMPYHSQATQAPDQALLRPWQRAKWSSLPASGVFSPGPGATGAQRMGQQYYRTPGHNGMDWRP